MALRKIIEINEDKCDGCGLCVTGCAEGALKIIDGKARLVSDMYCDGLGACLGECPNGALTIIEREAPDFDEEAVKEYLDQKQEPAAALEPLACGCPGSLARELKPRQGPPMAGPAPRSTLRNWPVQLHLIPPRAPYLQGASLLIAADCAGFAYPALHSDFLPDKVLIIACPKLDDAKAYEAKLETIFRDNDIKEINVLYMTVPCCFGLVHLVRQAIKRSGREIPLRLVQVDPGGEITQDECEQAA